MNIHEYQAKKLMGEKGIPVLSGGVANTSREARKVAESLGGNTWVVKAQIHAGGRGKAGGVKLAKSLDQVEAYSEELLGKVLITPQTDSQGEKVLKVLVEEGCQIAHEYYASIVLDRSFGGLVLMASSEGGVDIEEVAQKTPEKIIKVNLGHGVGFTPFIGRKLAYGIGLKDKEEVKEAVKFFQGLYELYVHCDCASVEINPLVKTEEGHFVALDAKLTFDDNALFRHGDIEELRDLSGESSREREAHRYGLSYIALDGNIGCLVNGAGLAMATMDIISIFGGRPANFLDVGGDASREAVQKAFSLILSDEKVKAILVNIFGGIMKCDIIAEGIVAVAKELDLKVPLVVRLEGTNVALGKKILDESHLDIIAASDLGDAAEKVVEAASSLVGDTGVVEDGARVAEK